MNMYLLGAWTFVEAYTIGVVCASYASQGQVRAVALRSIICFWHAWVTYFFGFKAFFTRRFTIMRCVWCYCFGLVPVRLVIVLVLFFCLVNSSEILMCFIVKVSS